VGGRCPKKPKNAAAALQRDLRQGRNPLSEGSVSRTAAQAAAIKGAERVTQKAVVRIQAQLKKLPPATLLTLGGIGLVLAAGEAVQRAYLGSERRGLQLALDAYTRSRNTLLAQYAAKRMKMPASVENVLLQQLKVSQDKISRVYERGKTNPFSEY
jgi:hypothetical protein